MSEAEEVPPSEDKKIPYFLYLAYLLVAIWGIWAFFSYWNGSHGWLDRGYWHELQEAAGTTMPFEKKESYLTPFYSRSIPGFSDGPNVKFWA